MNILDKSHCCGCASCYSSCPQNCISMEEDAEGFLYPTIDESKCVNCGLCKKVCPFLNPFAQRKPLLISAVKNKSVEVRLKSSSGGVFSLLAGYILERGGVVFGAAFDDKWEVFHTYIEHSSDLDKLRRSKYVQSKIGDTYKKTKDFLNAGRLVLFTVTPCQISGLLHFLRRDYNNLLTMDIVCHSVPSPKVWRKYLREYYSCESVSAVKDINFRNKIYGWKSYSFSLSLERDTFGSKKEKFLHSLYFDNLFMKFFLSDTISRPSCFACKAKNGSSGADITVGDYWWINEVCPRFDDDKGCSVVYVFSKKGRRIIDSIQSECDIIKTNSPQDIKRAYLLEGAFANHATPNKTRKQLFENIDTKSLEELRPLSIRWHSPRERFLFLIKKIIREIGIFGVTKKIYKALK